MKTQTYLTNMKSRCLMLVACLTLILGTTACSTEDFRTDLPEQEKTYTKHGKTYTRQELIEQALSRIPQTRANEITPVQMVTINKTVSIKCYASEEMNIDWGDFTYDIILAKDNSIYTHTYVDGLSSHAIRVGNSITAIETLQVDSNRLILLDINATNLTELYCQDNLLDVLDLTNCPALTTLDISNNELSSVEMTTSPQLRTFIASHNYLTDIDVSNNISLWKLYLDDNQLKDIDLSKNSYLGALYIGKNQIKNLNVRANLKLQGVFMDHLPLETYNGIPVDSVTPDMFSIHKYLARIDVAYTPFIALDLSQNSSIHGIDISGTTITHLDLSRFKMRFLRATRSKLESFNYTKDTFIYFYDLRLERTPLENDFDCFKNLVGALSSVEGPTRQKTLYTYSRFLDLFTSQLVGNNWIINP